MNDKKINTLENLEQPDSNSLSDVEARVMRFGHGKKYNIIYADPPWQYNKKPNKKGRAVECHYPTMPIDDIYNLPIESLAEENCVLFIWVTFPKLYEGIETLKRWGFNYKTVAFVWVKTNKNTATEQFSFLPTDSFDSFWGMGNWTRSNVEICLLGTRGKPLRRSASVHQVIYSPIDKHSKKPAEARMRIVKLMGDLPRVELFARQKTDGWDVWGNQVESDIEVPKHA